MEEKWKPCLNYENYEISNLGNIKNKNNKILKTHFCNSGYKKIVLHNGKNKRKTYTIHRLVMLTFKPNEIFEKATVNHKDGNKLNNNLDNLEWCTQKENLQHAFKIGLIKHNKTYKLKEEDIPKIKDLFDKLKNYTQVGKEFGISDNAVRKIIKGKTWTHI